MDRNLVPLVLQHATINGSRAEMQQSRVYLLDDKSLKSELREINPDQKYKNFRLYFEP